jgi:hypothetical protein
VPLSMQNNKRRSGTVRSVAMLSGVRATFI